MFDINKSVDLIRGGLIDPRATWQSYATENRSWQDTAMLLTLPLIVGSWIGAGILSLIFRRYSLFGAGAGFGHWLFSLIVTLIEIGIASLIFAYLAGVFEGRNDYNKGLAALSLAAVPGYVGNIVSPIPFIGWIVMLALGIVSLVFLYQIMPMYLEVPEDKRVVHYVVSLAASIVAMFILAAILGAGGLMSMHRGMSAAEQSPAVLGAFNAEHAILG